MGSNVPPNTPRTDLSFTSPPCIRPLKARPRFLQKSDLFRRRCTAKDRIAVRIAAEAAHDDGVLFGPVQRRPVTRLPRELGEKGNRSILNRSVFRMLERQVDKGALITIELTIATLVDDADCGGERFGITRECARLAAIGVARELVEQEDPGERSARVGAPLAKAAADRQLDRVPETVGDRRVES